jgi:AcrR family transcriptional regulator
MSTRNPRGTRRAGHPTREETAQLDRDLREAALQVFLDEGYEGASVAAIAAAAHTTKASLYARYASKEELFAAVVSWAVARTDWPYEEPPPPEFDDLEAALMAIAVAANRRALDPSMVKLSRIAVAQAGRFPELARHSAITPRQHLVVELLKYHVGEGTIVADDVEILADHFIAMVAGMPARRASLGALRSERDERRHLEVAVALFRRGLEHR